MPEAIELRRYQTGSGRDVFGDWLSGLKDTRTKAKILTRIERLALGNVGDCKSLGDGLFELRIDWGTGLSGLLRDGWPSLRVAALWRRQA